MKYLKYIITFITILVGFSTSSQAAIIYSNDFNLENWGGTSGSVIDLNINLVAIESIESISIELSHSWASDIDFNITAFGGVIFSLVNNKRGSDTFGDGGSVLSGTSIYEFVGSGGLDLSADTGGNVIAGTYNAEAWQTGPFTAGLWNISLYDTFADDDGAVGNITINGTLATVPVPPVITLFILGLFGLGFTVKYKKS